MAKVTPGMNVRKEDIIAIVAVALANVGLYFIAYIFTPILTGALAAYMIRTRKRSSLVAFIGSTLAYVPLELIAAPEIANYLIESGIFTNSELQAAIGMFYLILLIAALLLSIVSAVASFVFSTLFRRMSEKNAQE